MLEMSIFPHEANTVLVIFCIGRTQQIEFWI